MPYPNGSLMRFDSKDELLSSGSIIHWNDIKSLPRPVRKRRCIGITCGDCKELRHIPLDTLKIQIQKAGFTGYCQKCINFKGQKVKTKCDFCGCEMEVNCHDFKKLDHHFCCRECYKKWFRAGGYKLRSYNLSDEGRKVLSEKMKGERNPRYQAKPVFTEPEIILSLIIDIFHLHYKFVGDGSFWIESINPDFVNTNNKKIIIEVFGDYWHNLPEKRKLDFEKEAVLEQYGWKRIVLWEHDLKESSFKDIADFIKRSEGVYHSLSK